ncbi:helix-turn-helix transcriptional regulator [Streptomyces sp. RerS4]|uniref:helix-turn-helix domain-containing protein n=1 Tax=Streptomyces sp. RerS4 TaxID=2942449 RepID=UPI00201BF7EC|nr:helix-turn-helix transcriptional regulator [Streptomyces sp. RerS4]UQX02410.1 helix-turn-helix transcriptional regulator [Streptomyces sp. RerS4]
MTTDENGGTNDNAIDADLKNFGDVVKACRKRAGLTQEQFHTLVGYSVQYVAGVEQGRRHPSVKFVNKAEEVLDAFGLIRIAARQLDRRRGLAKWFRRWAELEAEAIALNTYECRSVPGLLQTEAYARALVADVLPPPAPMEAESRIKARLERQALIHRTPYTVFSFIIDEAVILRQTGGPEVTRELIDHLVTVAELPNVDLQIMPLVSPHHAGLGGSFQLLETQEHEWVGYSEGQKSGHVIFDPKAVSDLHQRYAKLRIQALNPADTVGLLMRMRGSL